MAALLYHIHIILLLDTQALLYMQYKTQEHKAGNTRTTLDKHQDFKMHTKNTRV